MRLKQRLLMRALAMAFTAGQSLWTWPLQALPQNGVIKEGTGTIVVTAPNRIDVTQTSSRLIIDWSSFNLGFGEQIFFNQALTSSSVLNRVIGGGASSINGQISATGHFSLVNASGISFGASARVDVASLIATTSNIKNTDFMAGRFAFTEASPNKDALILNQGVIRVADGGYAALSAAAVRNEGIVEARYGTVVLGGAKAFTVDLDGDRLLSYQVTTPVDQAPAGVVALIENTGSVKADGGRVLMTARAAKNVLDNVINTTGLVQATTASLVNGEIVIDGGDTGIVGVSGRVDATGQGQGDKGGTVKVLGEKVGLMAGAVVDASGDSGGGTVLIGGNYLGQGPEQNAKATYVDAAATIHADATILGNGGKVIVWSDEYTGFYGSITARGGAEGGNGGFVETSSKNNLQAFGSVSASAPAGLGGTWLLDPFNVTIAGATANGTYTAGVFTPTATGSTINAASIEADLNAGTNVTIQTSGGGGGEAGDITVAAPIDKSSGGAATLTLNADGTIAINSAISDTAGNLSLALISNGDITQTAAIAASGANGLSLSAGGNDITLTNASNNFATLQITNTGGAGNVQLTSTVSVNIATSSLGTGTFTLNSVGGGQTGPITQAGGAGAVSFVAAGANNWTFTDTGNNFTGPVSFTSVGGGDSSIHNGSNPLALGTTSIGGNLTVQTTGGALTQTGGLTIGGTSSFAVGAAPITLTSTANNFTGDVALSNTGANAVSISTDNASFLDLAASTVGSNLNLQTDNLGTVTSVTLNGALTIEPTTLSRNLTFGTGGGALVLDNTQLAGFSGYTSLTFGSASGTGTLNVGPSGIPTLASNIDLTLRMGGTGGAINVNGALATSGTGDLTLLAGTGGIALADDLTTGTGDMTLTGAAILSGTPNLTTSGGNLAFSTTVDGTGALVVSTGAGNVNFGGELGGTTPVGSLSVTSSGTITLTGNVTTNGLQQYNGAVTIAANTVLDTNNAGNIVLGSTVNGNFNFAANSGAGNSISFGGNVTTTGTQTYTGPATLAANATFTTTNASISFNDTIDGSFDLITNSGTGPTSLNAAVGGATEPTSYATTGTTGFIFLSAGVTTVNDQTYTGPVSLFGNQALTTTGGGDITLNGPINGGFNLTTSSGAGNTTFAAVGPSTPLASLSAATSGGTIFLTNDATTTGSQIYSGPVELTNNAILATTNSAITFNSTLNGAFGLLADSGTANLTFSGAVGGTTPLASIDSLGVGTTNIGSSITTVGAQFYGGTVDVNAASTLTTTALATGGITVIGGVNLNAGLNVVTNNSGVAFTSAIDGGFALAANTGAGGISFGGAIGAVTPLTSIDTTGTSGFVQMFFGATTTGNQTYTGAMVLNGAVSLTSSGGNIALNSVDGTNTFNLSAATGTVTFNDDAGGATPLASINVAAGSGLSLRDVTTAGTQTYAPAASLSGALQATNSAITFSGNVTLAGPSSMNSGTATTTLSGTMTAGTFGVLITADDVALGGNWTGTGNWQMRPSTAAQTIGLAGGAGGFNLSAGEIGFLNNGTSVELLIGSTAITGAVNTNAFTFDSPLVILGGDITLGGTLTKNTGSLGLGSSGAISGDLNLAGGTGVLQVSAATTVTLTGTVNGIAGIGAAAQALVIPPIGTGPFTANGENIPIQNAPPPPPLAELLPPSAPVNPPPPAPPALVPVTFAAIVSDLTLSGGPGGPPPPPPPGPGPGPGPEGQGGPGGQTGDGTGEPGGPGTTVAGGTSSGGDQQSGSGTTTTGGGVPTQIMPGILVFTPPPPPNAAPQGVPGIGQRFPGSANTNSWR